jgi:hypothetical protein
MYQALGRAVTRNADNSFTVKVEILTAQGKTVRVQSYTVRNMAELRAAAKADLDTLVAAEKDATLSAAIVDVLLAEV